MFSQFAAPAILNKFKTLNYNQQTPPVRIYHIVNYNSYLNSFINKKENILI